MKLERPEGGDELARAEIDVRAAAHRDARTKRKPDAGAARPAGGGEKAAGRLERHVDQSSRHVGVHAVALGGVSREMQP